MHAKRVACGTGWSTRPRRSRSTRGANSQRDSVIENANGARSAPFFESLAANDTTAEGLLLDQFGILVRPKQIIELRRLGRLQHEQPALAVSIAVDGLGGV